MFFTILGFLLVPCDTIPPLIRLRHLLRTKSVAGLSGVAVAQWSVSWWAWAVYAVLIESLPLLIVSVITAIVETIYLLFTKKAGLLSWRLILALAIGGVLLVTVGIGVNPEIIAATVTIVDLLVLYPQIRRAIKETDLSGISITAWLFDLMQDFGWIVYGFGIGHPLLAGWSLVSAPSSMLILFFAIRKRRRKENRRDASPAQSPPVGEQ